MKQRIEPTHFIEQYSTKPDIDFLTHEDCYTIPLPMSFIEQTLAATKLLSYRHTVAVWKIKAKPLSTNEVKTIDL